MKYTIITACLNSIETNEKSINSVMIQKFLPNQYIFIDGGSKDGTLEYLERVKIDLNKLKVDFLLINQETKGGIYEAWNIGLKEVDNSSENIFILNSDDWYFDNTIELVSNFFKNNIKVEILCGKTLNYYANGKKLSQKQKLKPFSFFNAY